MLFDKVQNTPFENAWGSLEPGYSMFPKRVGKIDLQSSVLFEPILYNYSNIILTPSDLPTDEWIITNLQNFVRGELGILHNSGEFPFRNDIIEPIQLSQLPYQNYLDNCIDQLLHGHYLRRLIKGASLTLCDKVFRILTDPLIGNKLNLKYLDKGNLEVKLQSLMSQRLPIQLIFPGFPFKDQNIFRTLSNASHVDFSEVASLIRLHILALSLSQVYPFGVEWIIVSEGNAFAEMLHVSLSDVREYFINMKTIRNLLKLNGTISIVDLKDMTNKIKSCFSGIDVFSVSKGYIEERIKLLLTNDDPRITRTIKILVRGIKWNVNLKSINASAEDLWLVLNAEDCHQFKGKLHALWKDINSLATDAAVKYAGFNLAVRFYSLISQLLPTVLRATINPKYGQIAVPHMGSVYPWNGVGTIVQQNFGPTSVESWPLYKLLRVKSDVIPYTVSKIQYPLFYSLVAL